MSRETPKDDPRQQTDWQSHKQSDEPWKGPAGERAEPERGQAGSGEVAENQDTLSRRSAGSGLNRLLGR